MKGTEKVIVAIAVVVYCLALLFYIGLLLFDNGVDSSIHAVFISTLFLFIILFIAKRSRKRNLKLK
ncbi:hypothetical protein [Paraliobacillus zengyii]|uniref:hypothetical protein n=1 Tax=Paraliobacillus zengyii TaxID=2213194 RepID=UPI000DD3FFC7|nr:hypothetical protein [Paraliobacillus zengyii]